MLTPQKNQNNNNKDIHGIKNHNATGNLTLSQQQQ